MILKLENINSVNSSISINNIDIDKIVVSSKISFDKKGFKYFIGYKDIKNVDLYVYCVVPKMSAYGRDLMKVNVYLFLIKDDELLERYNEIWEEVSNSIKKGFDSEPAYHEKYLKLKLNSMRKKSTQIFVMIKYQKKVLNLFVSQKF